MKKYLKFNGKLPIKQYEEHVLKWLFNSCDSLAYISGDVCIGDFLVKLREQKRIWGLNSDKSKILTKITNEFVNQISKHYGIHDISLDSIHNICINYVKNIILNIDAFNDNEAMVLSYIYFNDICANDWNLCLIIGDMLDNIVQYWEYDNSDYEDYRKKLVELFYNNLIESGLVGVYYAN